MQPIERTDLDLEDMNFISKMFIMCKGKREKLQLDPIWHEEKITIAQV